MILLGNQVAMAAPDLTITKTTSSTFQQGGNATYTLTITNSGNATTTSTFNVADTMPTGLTLASTPVASGFDCSASTANIFSAVSTSPLAAGAFRTINLPVNIAANAATSITNTATVSGGGEIITNNNSGSVVVSVTAVKPDLTITKTTSSTFLQGGSAIYTLTITNAGNGPTTSTFSVADNMPTGLTLAVTPVVAGFDCSASTATIFSAVSTSPLAAGASRTINLLVSIAANAPTSITNTATVSGGGETTTNNNSGSVSVTTLTPDLTITKTTSSTFLQGGNATYTLTITNSGTGPTTSTFTVSDNMPTGLTLASTPVAAGFDCSASTANIFSAFSTSPLAAGASRTINLPVNIAANAAASIINIATVSGGGEATTNNNSGSAIVSVTALTPDLTISKTTSSTFLQGGNATYTLTITNAGTGPTTSTFSVSDNMPTGLTLASTPVASGFDCSASTANIFSAVSTSPLAAGASRTINLPVNIAANAATSITNTATVSGGGETITNNNSGSVVASVTAVKPDLTITKTTSSTFLQGGNATYTLTITNSGTGPTTSTFSVSDNMPTGLTLASTPVAAGFDCSASTANIFSAVSTSPLAAGASRTINLPVNIAANAPTSITNTATVSGGGETTTNNNAGSVVVSVTAVTPDLTITKTTSSTFLQGGNATYTLTITNSGTGPTTSTFTVSDNMPTGLTLASTPAAAGFDCSASTANIFSAVSTSPLAAGASRTINLPVNIAANAATSITNTATVSGGGETNSNNNSGSVVVSVISAPPDISVLGRGVNILNGDNTPDATDDTSFGEVSASSGSVSHAFTIENPGAGSLTLGTFTVYGLNSSDFQLIQPLVSVIPSGGNTSFTIIFNPVGAGSRTASITITNNDPDENPFSFSIQGTGLTDLETWRFLNFRTVADAGNAANLLDADNDGMVNLIEFAFGLNPNAADSGSLPAPVITPTSITYNFNEPGPVSGITYGAEYSTTLEARSWTAITDTGTAPLHNFTVSTSGQSKIFVRLTVTTP